LPGLYLHIPFCKQACRYCDFYFTVSLQYIERFTDAILTEMQFREKDLGGTPLQTLYLGGGTPSLLPLRQLERLMNTLHKWVEFRKDAEITIECNPDDLNPPRLDALFRLGFNRLSIGIQSFHEQELRLMRRSHSADQAKKCVWDAARAGFNNISIDLIYGLPGQDLRGWEENLDTALSLPVSHLSAYHLTFEPGTVFDHWRKRGKLQPVTEETSLEQYHLLRERTGESGFEHYEISNFAREGNYSAHNLLYWSGNSYMGLGPSAHSYRGQMRRWNVASMKTYSEALETGQPFWEEEQLSKADRYHDYLITSLRTQWGADQEYIETQIGETYARYLRMKSQPFLHHGDLILNEKRLVIPPARWFIMDHILRELFLEERAGSQA
jgi:oxygen-independent coproporphyrinogen-3 oxidase